MSNTLAFMQNITETGGETISGAGKGAIGAITGTVLAVTAVLKSIEQVPTGEIGVRTRNGRVLSHSFGSKKGKIKYVQPGGHNTWIGLRPIRRISLQDRTTDLPEVLVDVGEDISEKVQYGVRTSIFWRVSADRTQDHPYMALFNVPNTRGDKDDREVENNRALTETVTNRCEGGLLRVLLGMPVEKWPANEQVFSGLREACSEELLGRYGVELFGLEVKQVAMSTPEKGRRLIHSAVEGDLGSQVLPGSRPALHGVASAGA